MTLLRSVTWTRREKLHVRRRAGGLITVQYREQRRFTLRLIRLNGCQEAFHDKRDIPFLRQIQRVLPAEVHLLLNVGIHEPKYLRKEPVPRLQSECRIRLRIRPRLPITDDFLHNLMRNRKFNRLQVCRFVKLTPVLQHGITRPREVWRSNLISDSGFDKRCNRIPIWLKVERFHRIDVRLDFILAEREDVSFNIGESYLKNRTFWQGAHVILRPVDRFRLTARAALKRDY